MKEKSKRFPGVGFGADTLRRAFKKFDSFIEKADKSSLFLGAHIYRGDENWACHSLEEALADFGKAGTSIFISVRGNDDWRFEVTADGFECKVTVGGSTEAIAQVMDVFEADAANAKPVVATTPPKDPFTIFIGHGRSNEWSKLMIHLQQSHGLKVEAYESGCRAGHTIRDILESMMANSSMAVLVMTGEDDMEGGVMRARQNVVHEVGLFQGRLGFHRALVLLEEGCEKFSNLDGIQWISFSRNNIREAYGDVLAAIKREQNVPSG